MPFDPAQFDQGSSRFSAGSAAANRGTFASYLSGDSQLGNFSAQMAQGFTPPGARNAKRAESESAQGQARNQGLWGGGLNTTNNQFQSMASLGNAGLSGIQQAKQAKEMAQMQAASAQQNSIFGGINAGISLLGAMRSPGGIFNRSSGSSFGGVSFPSSSWSIPNTFG
jgi:hypothetical protein